MRDIKFRLYDTERKMMVEYLNCSICIDGSGVQSFNSDGEIEGTELNKHLIPLQYSGLKDKNGKEVYENDIAKTSEDVFVVKIGEFAPTWLNEVCSIIGMEKQHRIYGVYAENKEGCCIMESGHGFEVIGNIYENPELLEEK